MTNNWGVVVAIGLVVIFALAAGAVYSLRKRYAYDLQSKTGYKSEQNQFYFGKIVKVHYSIF